MKQLLFIISSILFILLSASAQKEVYFNTMKPEDIKVNSMQGIEARLSLLPDGYTSELFSFPPVRRSVVDEGCSAKFPNFVVLKGRLQTSTLKKTTKNTRTCDFSLFTIQST